MQFMTPLLTSKLAGQYVAVDPMGLFVSTSQVCEVSNLLFYIKLFDLWADVDNDIPYRLSSHLSFWVLYLINIAMVWFN